MNYTIGRFLKIDIVTFDRRLVLWVLFTWHTHHESVATLLLIRER